VENVEVLGGEEIKFDFLGKDSIRYENTVKVSMMHYSTSISALLFFSFLGLKTYITRSRFLPPFLSPRPYFLFT
jgi:hypothetical protein